VITRVRATSIGRYPEMVGARRALRMATIEGAQALVWSASSASIAETWVDGRRLFSDGRVATIDERALHREARARAAAIVARAGLARADVPVTTSLYE
jgi:cytosine/adenosine deaminase-related metal-dependent hydrolase